MTDRVSAPPFTPPESPLAPFGLLVVKTPPAKPAASPTPGMLATSSTAPVPAPEAKPSIREAYQTTADNTELLRRYDEAFLAVDQFNTLAGRLSGGLADIRKSNFKDDERRRREDDATGRVMAAFEKAEQLVDGNLQYQEQERDFRKEQAYYTGRAQEETAPKHRPAAQAGHVSAEERVDFSENLLKASQKLQDEIKGSRQVIRT
jgi:hypothetical protein